MIIIPGKKKNLAIRYYANFFDYAILLILTVIYIYLAGDGDERGTYRVTGIKFLPIPLVWLLYFPVCESIFGQTIGKRAFNLHIVDLQGDTPNVLQAFSRRMLDIFEISMLGIPALLTINYSKRNQRLGDLMAGTTVVRTDGICRFCGAELQLLPKEVVRDIFKCPNCNEVN